MNVWQVVEHLKRLSADAEDEVLQTWSSSGPTVESIFSKIFKFLQTEVRL